MFNGILLVAQFWGSTYNIHFFCFYHPELPPLPPTTTPKPGASTTRPTTTTTTTTHAPGSGFCNGKPDGLYANPDDKSTFYMCAGGVSHLRPCGTGSIFDDSCKCCVWPWGVKREPWAKTMCITTNVIVSNVMLLNKKKGLLYIHFVYNHLTKWRCH